MNGKIFLQCEEISSLKSEIRKTMQLKRRHQSEVEMALKSGKIWERLNKMPEFNKAESIMFYLSLPYEVCTRDMVKGSMRMGKKVIVPVVDKEKNEIFPCFIGDYDKELEAGMFDVLEPGAKYRKMARLEDIDLVIIPGLAFDESGGRLGFGKGYYDKFLKKLCRNGSLIALAFEFQIVKELPVTKNDVGMEKIITEGRIIDCKKQN